FFPFCFKLYSRILFLFSFFPIPMHTTLFPYMTLFRSLHRQVVPRIADVVDLARGDAVLVGDDRHQRVDAVVEVGEGALLPPAVEDRKSTRLNSSHVAISYAVFCLKKKMNMLGFQENTY